MKFSRLLSNLIATGLSLVAAPSSNAIEPATFPRFEGTVVLIEQPVRLEYQSHASRETYITSGRMVDAGRSEQWSDKLVADRTVRRRDKRLERRFKAIERTSGQEEYELASSELTFEVSSDITGGNIEGARLRGWDSFVQKVGSAASTSEESRAQLLDFYKSDEALLVLPSQPVKSGDIVQSIPLVDALAGAGIADTLPDQVTKANANSVLRGYGYLDGRKVFLLDLWGDVAFDEPGSARGSIIMGGYALLDAQTLATVVHRVKLQVDLESMTGEKNRLQLYGEEALTAEVRSLRD